jgi:hypothetical protein
MVVRPNARDRIEVRLPPQASTRQARELGAFARYCVVRIEREIGDCELWIVAIEPSLGGYRARVAVCDRGVTIEQQGTGHDGPLAIWDAMCSLEQRLRELRRPAR